MAMLKNAKAQRLLVLAVGGLLGYCVATGNVSSLLWWGGAAEAGTGRQAREEPISFEIRVPADATLEIDGEKTTSTGTARQFETPPLAPGHHYQYTVKVRHGTKEYT